MKHQTIMVIGGAGFIGSHIVDHLVGLGVQVIVYDNLSTGNPYYLKAQENNIRFIKGDILDSARLTREMKGVDGVFHLAANADVRGGMQDTRIDLEQNVLGTHSVLEAMRIQEVKKIAFSSSATVYGEPDVFPTPENHELIQTSVYGASKLAGEAYIEAYCEYYAMQCFIFRFVSWIGERYSHGVIYDFIKKLQQDPARLEILGDGKQKKSYLYVKDGVAGIFKAMEVFTEKKNIFNLGHTDSMPVTRLADIVIDEMGLKDVEFCFTGGKRGWIGDSPLVLLDTKKLNDRGWAAKTSLEDGIRKTARYLLDNPETMTR